MVVQIDLTKVKTSIFINFLWKVVLWKVVSTKREHFTPSKYSHVCSEYFLPSDYVYSQHDLKPRLKPQSVPSIFKFPERLQPKKHQRKPPVKRSLPEDKPNENLQPSTCLLCIF